MVKLAADYPDFEFVQTVSAQIQWSHNVAILEKVKDPNQRKWYINKTGEIFARLCLHLNAPP